MDRAWIVIHCELFQSRLPPSPPSFPFSPHEALPRYMYWAILPKYSKIIKLHLVVPKHKSLATLHAMQAFVWYGHTQTCKKPYKLMFRYLVSYLVGSRIEKHIKNSMNV